MAHEINLGRVAGLPPAHQWSGTMLRFQNPNGTWGVWNNLAATGSGADNTQLLQLENPKAEAEFMIDSLMFWIFRQFWHDLDEGTIRCELACMPFEEKVATIVEEAQTLFSIMGLPDDWVFSYIPPDYVPEPTQQTLNFIAPLTQFIFDKFRTAQFSTRIGGYRYINLGSISGDFRIKGCDWSKLYLHGISASWAIGFIRPAARPDISQSWNCCHNLFSWWHLYGADLKFRYSQKLNRLIIEGRAICPSDHEIYDISIVYEGISRWSSYLLLDASSSDAFTIFHNGIYNDFNQ